MYCALLLLITQQYCQQSIKRYLAELSGTVPKVRDFIYIEDFKKTEDIVKLADTIVEAAEDIPNMPRILPSFYDEIENDLVSQDKPFIRMRELEQVIERKSIFLMEKSWRENGKSKEK